MSAVTSIPASLAVVSSVSRCSSNGSSSRLRVSADPIRYLEELSGSVEAVIRQGQRSKRKADDEARSPTATAKPQRSRRSSRRARRAGAGRARGREASVEKGIDAWKKIVAAAPASWAPRRELARVYKKAERWNALIEVMKEEVEKANGAARREDPAAPSR